MRHQHGYRIKLDLLHCLLRHYSPDCFMHPLFRSSVNTFKDLTKEVKLIATMPTISAMFIEKIINLSDAVKRKGNKNADLREKIAELCQNFTWI